MTIEERVKLYKELFPDCKALEPVAHTLGKGFKQGSPLQRLELLRELDTELAEAYNVVIPVITCWVRDDNYVRATKEIYLGEPTLEGFLHQFRHHLQNEARLEKRSLLLVEDNKDIDSRLPYKEAVSTLEGEDDARSWSRFIIENC